MKTEFVSLAAHQLRTPLSAIKWTLRMLLDGDFGEITEEQRGFIEKTYGSNERMISLINDLLNVTRIEEGRYLYKPVLTQIENVVQFVINSFKEETRRKKIRLEFKKPRKKLPQVKVDVERIRLAINNILDNAIRYTPVGGKVTTFLKCGKKEIELQVQDTGVGIPEDQKERVFTKFFRGANVMRMATEGTGLGLFIAKNIIEAHDGRIWFESEKDKGSVFHFTLPIKKS
jgi:signal transduction histidine kinase